MVYESTSGAKLLVESAGSDEAVGRARVINGMAKVLSLLEEAHNG